MTNYDYKLLTIGITSYNRVNELIRCLASIDSQMYDKIEVVISEDCSPKKDEIRAAVEEFIQQSNYNIRFHSNNVNIGYDDNLRKIIELSKGKYILYMSDDDCFAKNALDKILSKLEEMDLPMAYSSFYRLDKNEHVRKYNSDFEILPSEQNVGKLMYDSILFSGLIFKKELLEKLNLSGFKNSIYIQVYMFMSVIHNFGGYYFNVTLINLFGDGENGFGISDSSEKNPLLADRSSVISNLEYHKKLINVIKRFDNDNNTNIINLFSKEYAIRSYIGMTNARSNSKEKLNSYWRKLKELDIKLYPIEYIYYLLLLTCGSRVSDFLLIKLKHLVLRSRANNIPNNMSIH